MATFKGLFGRTLTGKARVAYTNRALARARKAREREESRNERQKNLARSQSEALKKQS